MANVVSKKTATSLTNQVNLELNLRLRVLYTDTTTSWLILFSLAAGKILLLPTQPILPNGCTAARPLAEEMAVRQPGHKTGSGSRGIYRRAEPARETL